MTNMGCDGMGYITKGGIVLIEIVFDNIRLIGFIDTSNVGSNSRSLRSSTNSPSG